MSEYKWDLTHKTTLEKVVVNGEVVKESTTVEERYTTEVRTDGLILEAEVFHFGFWHTDHWEIRIRERDTHRGGDMNASITAPTSHQGKKLVELIMDMWVNKIKHDNKKKARIP